MAEGEFPRNPQNSRKSGVNPLPGLRIYLKSPSYFRIPSMHLLTPGLLFLEPCHGQIHLFLRHSVGNGSAVQWPGTLPSQIYIMLPPLSLQTASLPSCIKWDVVSTSQGY